MKTVYKHLYMENLLVELCQKKDLESQVFKNMSQQGRSVSEATSRDSLHCVCHLTSVISMDKHTVSLLREKLAKGKN